MSPTSPHRAPARSLNVASIGGHRRQYRHADDAPEHGGDHACPDDAVHVAVRVVAEEPAAQAGRQREADAVIEQTEIAVKYAGYIDKQNDEVDRASALEHLALPDDLDYGAVTALSFEVRQTLARHRPATLGQASRISGVTPAAISLLLVHLKKKRFKGFEGGAAPAAPDPALA